MDRFAWFAVILFVAAPAAADTVEFANGDALSGTVVSLDAQKLVLQSEALGEVKLPAHKIAAVHFGDRRPAAKFGDAEAAPVADVAPDRPAAAQSTPDDLIRQLREGGLDAAEIDEVRKQFPLLNTPGAGGYFNKTLSGLIDGSIDVQNVGKDAIRAREGLLDIKKSLGPAGGALDGYLQILDNFIEETTPPSDGEKPTEP